MAKRLFLLLFFSLIEVIVSSNFVTTGEKFSIKSPEFNDVLTVEQKEDLPNTILSEQVIIARPEVATVAPVYVEPSNRIMIAGNTLEIIDVPDTSYDSGGHVNRYGGKFLYGHNSWGVFGGLLNVGVGNYFTIIDEGIVREYRVDRVVVFEKNSETGQLQLNGSGNYMRRVANAMFDGVTYGLSIMTCYGTSYGNGDASHRLVLFASAI